MMKLSLLALAGLALIPSFALADDAAAVTCVDGKFADHIEQGRPLGDAASIASAHKAVYWIDVANPGDATQVMLVWIVDGKEMGRQSLDVGHSPHWHTWGSRPFVSAHAIEVKVLDSAGNSLKEDSLALP